MHLHFIARVVSISFGRDHRGWAEGLHAVVCAEGAAAGRFRGWAQKAFLAKGPKSGLQE